MMALHQKQIYKLNFHKFYVRSNEYTLYLILHTVNHFKYDTVNILCNLFSELIYFDLILYLPPFWPHMNFNPNASPVAYEEWLLHETCNVCDSLPSLPGSDVFRAVSLSPPLLFLSVSHP